jgi:pantothenate kinase
VTAPALDRGGLLTAVLALARARPRVVVGLAGPPGAGKSTLAEWLVGAVGEVMPAAYLPMDGYHLSNAVLGALGRADRKGAPDTFDGHGYVAVLRRVRAEVNRSVYAPRFHREIEESIAAEIDIAPDVRVVVTEGNYLLLDVPPWDEVVGCLDAVWYVTVPEPVRIDRLVARRIGLGQPPDVARAWALGSDQRNAEVVAGTRDRASGEVGG